MKIGTMNNPSLEPIREIKRASKQGFDFIDFSIELNAIPSNKDIKKIKEELKRRGIGIVGHTDPNLPYSSFFPELRKASLDIFNRCCITFKKLGSEIINIHAFPHDNFLGNKSLKYGIDSLREFVKIAKKHRLKIMLENIDWILTFKDTLYVLRSVPGLYFHLDMSHAHINKKDMNEDYLKKLNKKLLHVHLSDNHGLTGKRNADEHLEIGKGEINWKKMINLLKKYKYDRTITLEIFKGDLIKSKNKILGLWKKLNVKAL